MLCLMNGGVMDLTQDPRNLGVPPSGKVSLFQRNWHAITSDRWVLDCVKGYEINWKTCPFQTKIPKELNFSQKDYTSLNEEVQKLLQKEAITLVMNSHEQSFVSQLFAVPKKDGGTRPVVNLKQLNSFVQPESFKMEGIHSLKDLLKAGDWMTKVDLKDAYFAIPVSRHHRKYLQFMWDGKTYQFNCLPFGLSSAPWVFTKTTKPVITILRTLGLRIIIYIDDILIMAINQQLVREHTKCLIFLLENLGFTINKEKSMTEPVQEIEFLGYTVNSINMELKLPGSKIKKIKSESRALLQTPQPSALAVSRLLGKMTHAAHAMKAAPLFYRHLQECLRRSLQKGEDQDYSQSCPLSVQAKEELEWWVEHLQDWDGRSILRPEPDLTIETDASTIGWGAMCQGHRTGGPWSKTEATMHINCLELLAATLATKTFAKERHDIVICLKMDNTSALTYINKFGGTVSPELNRLTKELWTWCLKKRITLRATHLAGVLNVTADEESRVMKDRTDWKLCPKIFQKINARFGPLEVDLFASRLTNQLPQYVSWRPDPAAMETDAFSLNWNRVAGYANPPWNLVPQVLTQTKAQEATVILVAPVWPSQPWYPVLLGMLFQEPALLPREENLILPTHPVNCPDITPHLAVWPISGRDLLTNKFQLRLQNSSSHHGDRRPEKHMTHFLTSGLAGVSKGISIPFQEI